MRHLVLGRVRLCGLLIAVLVLLADTGFAQPAFKVEQSTNGFTISTPRMDVTFEAGRIIALRNRLTGELLADPRRMDTRMPAGMGHLGDDLPAMRQIHSPWGTYGVQSYANPKFLSSYHAPDEKSTFTCAVSNKNVRARWQGLHNGSQRFPEEFLEIQTGSAADGALVFKAYAVSPSNGVYGVTIPLVNLAPEARFYLPSFGGMRFDSTIAPGLRTFGTAPFFEAPVMAAEIGQSAVAMWKEDAQFHPYFTFFNWTGRSFGFAFEHLNLMPFAPHTQASSPEWKLDVCQGGWMQALAPYKVWYADLFKHELAVRDGVSWADSIGVVIDAYQATPETLDKLAKLVPAGRVLMHDWNARAPAFDTELPDWTPRAGYVEKVKQLHAHGFKTMAYVNTYCANYNSPVWRRDNLANKFLTRKYTLHQYEERPGASALDTLIGTVQTGRGSAQFAGIKDGELMYGDPLNTDWRRYHTEQMVWWKNVTGTDANYEDTAGCAGDFGNGVVDGKFAGQGSVVMMQELLERQPNVPMASEYGPDAIAFAVKWPLVYAQVWGDDTFRDYRKNVQAPVNAYLFGTRTWIPTINAGTDFLKHVVAACSDATGGMGMMEAMPEFMESRAGFAGHMIWRSQVFARRGLKPWFDPHTREPHLVCMYRDQDGGLYRYFDNGQMQQLTGPDNTAIYARVEKTNTVTTALCLPGWPAVKGNTIFGLNPKQRYALFPKEWHVSPPVELDALPQGIAITQFRYDNNYALLALAHDGITSEKPTPFKVDIKLNTTFKAVTVNGTTRLLQPEAKRAAVDITALPATILLTGEAGAPRFDAPLENDFNKLKIRKVSPTTGLQELAVTNNLPSLRRTLHVSQDIGEVTSIVLWGPGWESTLDFLVTVPTATSAIKVYTKNISSQYGDATIAKIYINGELKISHDAVQSNPEQNVFDCACYEWIVPVGQHAGNSILISIASNPKKDDNSDQQWISLPLLVEDAGQQLVKRCLNTPEDK